MIEVVIPAHNAAPFLRETLESVAAQTRPPASVTVVNDRSTDATAEIAAQAATDLAPRIAIRVIPSAGPPGPSGARNTAIRASKADWIALCDADDLLLAHHHETLARLAGQPGIVFAFGDCCLFDNASRAILLESHHAKSGLDREPAEALADGGFTLGEGMFAAILRGGMIGTSASMLQREAALAAGLFDETMMYCEDVHLFLRMAARGRFAFTPERVAEKRVHDANLSHDRNDLPFRRGEALTVAKLLGRHPSPAHPAGFALTPAQRAALEATLPRALAGYLYEATRAGPRAFGQALKLCFATGHGAMALHPKRLARLAFRSAVRPA